MNNLYDVFNEDTASQQQSKPRLSKEEYAQMKKDERNALFGMANEQVSKAVTDPQSYMSYLNLMIQHDYTVTNTLLVMAQKPNAILLKDFQKWKELNKYPRNNATKVAILEPKSEYMKRDGTMGVNFDKKIVYDITELNGKPIMMPKKEHYDFKSLLKAVSHHSEVQPVVVNNMDLPESVYYEPKDQKIYVKAGLEPEQLLGQMIREYCIAEFAEGTAREDVEFVANSAAYSICQKYGIQGYDTSFASECTAYFDGWNQKDIKGELENIKTVYHNVSERMEHSLYAQQKNRNEKQADHDAR